MVYSTLLAVHSLLRWVVLAGMVTMIVRSYVGLRHRLAFSKIDNALRHWTATAAHIQLVVGIVLYTKSPVVEIFWRNTAVSSDVEFLFFGLLHFVLMLCAIIILTIGSAVAKRKQNGSEKFKTILVWFAIALVVIIIAIPWPFSPLASRPYLR